MLSKFMGILDILLAFSLIFIKMDVYLKFVVFLAVLVAIKAFIFFDTLVSVADFISVLIIILSIIFGANFFFDISGYLVITERNL